MSRPKLYTRNHRTFSDSTFQEAYLEMYALYVKNKPTSDRLLAESGKFFQTKQIELGDKMDLASYLLKPVQRLGKYSLFLDGISKTTKQKTELLKAKKIIQFQVSFVRNDLYHTVILLNKTAALSRSRDDCSDFPKSSLTFGGDAVFFCLKTVV